VYFQCEARQNYTYTGLKGLANLQETEAPRISIQSSHESFKVVSISTSGLYLPAISVVFFTVRVYSMAIARPVQSMKNPNESNP
jgi:hypothetical protein